MNRIAIDKTLPAILLALLLVAIKVPPVLAALANETLISHLPSGFKLGFNTEKGRMTMAEYVPEGETVEDWSRMITVQTFHGANHVDGDTFASGIAKQWKPACPGGDAQKIKGGCRERLSIRAVDVYLPGQSADEQAREYVAEDDQRR